MRTKHTPGPHRLYYHKTDGGAEYLCSEAVPGTDEGDLASRLTVRLDGAPEYRDKAESVMTALVGLLNIATHPKATKAQIRMIAAEARAAQAKL
jgi:hypothetical protein